MLKAKDKKILECARKVLQLEADAILKLIPGLNEDFCKAVRLILKSEGRLVIMAVGKSGHIGKKLAATLSSTGTPALFIHPTEALHGDLGMITPHDIILAISYSGESVELNNLIPTIKAYGSKVIGLTGRDQSSLARLSDITIVAKIEKEADPNNLAPTSSTTATLAIGDALAVALIEQRKFGARDFARLHPGGTLGRSFLETKDLMHSGENNPIIPGTKSLKDAIIIITSKGLGMVNVVDKKGKLTGILTDGDIRRLLLKAEQVSDIFTQPVSELMIKDPISVFPETLCLEAVRLMEDNRKHRMITTLTVINRKNQPVGVIHIHDLIRKGFTFKNDSNSD